VPATAIAGASDKVDLLLRPDDLSVSQLDDGGNGQIAWVRYEGGSWLYAVDLDEGASVQVRASHENQIGQGERVYLKVTTTHPLAAFARD
jgi:iron(III) transport system ATP-binding protein